MPSCSTTQTPSSSSSTPLEFALIIKEALAETEVEPTIINYRDLECGVEGMRLSDLDYEEVLAGGDPDYAWKMPGNEWNAISLNYTSGTTGNPRASSITIAAQR